MPGGWADIGYTPTEVAAKEVFEETGYEVDHFKLLAIFDKENINHRLQQRMYIKFLLAVKLLVVKRKLVLKQMMWSFGENELPNLSIARNTEEQIKQMFAYIKEPQKEIVID